MIDAETSRTPEPLSRPHARGRLFLKYVALVVSVVCVALLANGLVGIWFSYRDQKASLVGIQGEKAALAAVQIGQFVKEIEGQLGWMTQSPWLALTPEERRIDALRLLRQVPAITELGLIDQTGREQLRVSRTAMDSIGSGRDLSTEPAIVEAVARGVYYGPVYFHRGSEPYFTLALAGSRRSGGVAVAEVNLIYVWDVISQIKVGDKGKAYVLDATGRLIAHPDISLVLRNTDFARLAQVRRARGEREDASAEQAQVMRDVDGREVLTAHAAIAALGWLVFVELPVKEAYAPLYASLLATGLVLLGGLALAVIASLMLARKMVTPIRALQRGAARIGSGALDHRIDIRTGDELEALGDQFNSMASQLQDSYATLERKVEERTHQLQLANLAKSRFLAAASHDLRQPLHALNLFVAQLRDETDQAEKSRVIVRIDAAVAAMNELFNALLDISKLDAGVLAPSISEFPVDHLLKRIETTFTAAAREKGLRLRTAPSSAWIRSDFILLERIMLNLVSNAVRYTNHGAVVVGCRRRGKALRIEVWDSGIGIPEDQRRNIFGEFYQLGTADGDRRSGLGLGLAIVDRLCGLLDHPIELISTPARGSRFSVSVPLIAAPRQVVEPSLVAKALADPAGGKLVVVIDDDALVLDGMRGVLKSWGCAVVTAASDDAAIAALAKHGQAPDLIISDYRLSNGKTGFEAIARLRSAMGAPIPAFLISGDTAPERLREASASGYHLLHKPVLPMTLRAMLNQLLKDREDSSRSIGPPALGGSPPALQSAAIPSPATPPQ
jgi:signal transduction histidine kinase/DNA-binding NarL/FixJ family response regulator